MNRSDDTIVAISTPPGRGGLGVVRLSGERALEITARIIQLPKLPLERQRATLGTFMDTETGRTLDEVVVTCFCAPHSYTAEDVVEISCHGAPVILRYLVQCCLREGARAAEPGEFTLRAFLNGRIDLTQAEAVRDLIEAQTVYQARVAAQQLSGSVAARLKPSKQALLELIAHLEAGIDFAEDDVAVITWQEILSRLEGIAASLEKLAAGYDYGRIVRAGLTLAIVGPPNVGKSSLFNCLLNQDRAIVTPVPGTTRDLVAETASVGGIPLRFVDTAGVRDTADDVEKMGVERTWRAIADSDLRLLVVDTSEAWTEEDTSLLERLHPLGALIIAMNKSDLPPAWGNGSAPAPDADPGARSATSSRRGPCPQGPLENSVRTSALTGEGIPELKERILDVAAPAHGLGGEGEFITNLRHHQLVQDSLRGLARAREAAARRVPHEMLLLDLYEALRPLDLVTGATYADDILDVIFKTFCVGK